MNEIGQSIAFTLIATAVFAFGMWVGTNPTAETCKSQEDTFNKPSTDTRIAKSFGIYMKNMNLEDFLKDNGNLSVDNFLKGGLILDKWIKDKFGEFSIRGERHYDIGIEDKNGFVYGHNIGRPGWIIVLENLHQELDKLKAKATQEAIKERVMTSALVEADNLIGSVDMNSGQSLLLQRYLGTVHGLVRLARMGHYNEPVDFKSIYERN